MFGVNIFFMKFGFNSLIILNIWVAIFANIFTSIVINSKRLLVSFSLQTLLQRVYSLFKQKLYTEITPGRVKVLTLQKQAPTLKKGCIHSFFGTSCDFAKVLSKHRQPSKQLPVSKTYWRLRDLPGKRLQDDLSVTIPCLPNCLSRCLRK